jgi:hypothetical protein
MLSVAMPSFIMLCSYAECHYAECRGAEEKTACLQVMCKFTYFRNLQL